MRYSVLIFLFLFLSACSADSDKRKSEKYENLLNYYRNELRANLPENGIIIILQNQRCSSCRLATFQRLTQKLEANSLKKTFILSKNDTTLVRVISSIPNHEIIVDALDRKSEYGLDYATDLFFLFKGSKLEKWFEISNDNLDNIKFIE